MKNFKKHFLNDETISQKRLLDKTIKLGFDFISGKERGFKPLVYKNAKELKMLVDRYEGFENGITYEKGFEILKQIGKYSVSQADLNYIAFPDSGNALPSFIADIYAKFINQNMITLDRGAPIATFIEIQLLEWLRKLIGYDHKRITELTALADVSGMCTTGGHMSNHIAILGALYNRYPEAKVTGLPALGKSPKIVLSGGISHYSYSSAMHHLGLGQENILIVNTSDGYKTDPEDVLKCIEKNKHTDEIFMVVAVAGNSRTTSIDDIKGLSKICQKYNLWLHVDACHGGSLLFSDKLKKNYLDGIELADSVSLDPHKGIFTTYPSSYVMFKNRDILTLFTRYEDKVRDGTSWDLGYITPFYGSRGFESLKLWFMFKILGKKFLSDVVEQRAENAKYAAKLIETSGYFTLFHDMDFYRLVFVYQPKSLTNTLRDRSIPLHIKKELKKCVDYFTHNINQTLYESGELILDEFKLHDVPNSTRLDASDDKFNVMSISIGNPLYTKASLRKSIGILIKISKKYEMEFNEMIEQIIKGETFGKKILTNCGPAGWN